MKSVRLIEFLSTKSVLTDVLSDEDIIALFPYLRIETVDADTVLR